MGGEVVLGSKEEEHLGVAVARGEATNFAVLRRLRSTHAALSVLFGSSFLVKGMKAQKAVDMRKTF